jgi:capsule polysaccharide export protein KpsE/RkpR
MIKDGVIVHHRPETYIEYNNNYISILQILLTRFLYFFAPYSNMWSMVHIVINALFFSIIGSAVFVSELCVDASRVKNRIALKAKAILMFTVVAIAVYQSMTLIDYDWRYRYPAIALLISLAVIEVSLFLEQKSFSFNKKARHP